MINAEDTRRVEGPRDKIPSKRTGVSSSPCCVLDRALSASSRASTDASSFHSQRAVLDGNTPAGQVRAAAVQLGIGAKRRTSEDGLLPLRRAPLQPSHSDLTYDSEEDIFSCRASGRSSHESTRSYEGCVAALGHPAHDSPVQHQYRAAAPGYMLDTSSLPSLQPVAEHLARSFGCAPSIQDLLPLEGPQTQVLHTSAGDLLGTALSGVARQRTSFNQNAGISDNEAAAQLFFRLNHARQTVDYATRQKRHHESQRLGPLSVWAALEKLMHLREYEALLLAPSNPRLDGSLSLVEHALRTAEACRQAYPQHDWLHLIGLIHGLGKLLAAPEFGGLPQWAVSGETFPVGCQFAASLPYARFFSANPDKRRRCYSSPCGMYAPGGGLASTLMSWSAAEYLHTVLARSCTALPPAAHFLVRYQKFHALLRGGYTQLLDSGDRALLPLLSHFQELSSFHRSTAPAPRLQDVKHYYDGLIHKYLPGGCLQF